VAPAPRPLLDRDPTPDDRDAERDPPRPGVWAGERGADFRPLTQDQTDRLIRLELIRTCHPDDTAHVIAACGGDADSLQLDRTDPPRGMSTQRGGIDSDPLIRVLARRAWADRDRQWFELRAERTRDAARVLQTRFAWRRGR